MNMSRLRSSIPKLVVLGTTLLFLWSMTTSPAWAKVGAITQFPLPAPSSATFGITLGPDGKVWFTESSGNNIGRITTSEIITEFPIPTSGSLPHGITAGSDRNVWFTELDGNDIGRITTSDAITQLPATTRVNLPHKL